MTGDLPIKKTCIIIMTSFPVFQVGALKETPVENSEARSA